MYVQRQISFRHLFNDSWRLVLLTAIWAMIVVYCHEILGLVIFSVPVVPVSTVGIAVSFYLGFKSTSAYGRWWEARKIWGAIVNDSRIWGNEVFALIFAHDEKVDKQLDPKVRAELIHRHLAWINAMAHQLRQRSRLKDSQVTRIFDHRLVVEGVEYHHLPESYQRFLSESEREEMAAKENPATHILRRQGDRLRELAQAGFLDDNRLVQMVSTLNAFYTYQGQCERIKNTPFPRQVANFGQIFTWLFIFLLPLAFVEIFGTAAENHDLESLLQSQYMITLVPFTVLVSWVFFIMEKVSDNTEDPFEGGVTDVPISSLCRVIEVDLKQMLDDPDIPQRQAAVDGVIY